jgi:uncharacterized membrane protein
MHENEKPGRPADAENAGQTAESAPAPPLPPKSSDAQRALQEAERALRMAAAKAGIALREMGREVSAEVDAAVTDLRQAAEPKVSSPAPDPVPAAEPELAPPSTEAPGGSPAIPPPIAEPPAGDGPDDWTGVSGTGLEPNLAAALSYVGWAMTGILFFYVFEPRDRFVRFHALQSILLTAALMVVGVSVTAVPLIGPFLFRMAAVGFVLAWLLAIWKALRHELYPLPFIGEIARGQVDRRAG